MAQVAKYIAIGLILAIVLAIVVFVFLRASDSATAIFGVIILGMPLLLIAGIAILIHKVNLGDIKKRHVLAVLLAGMTVAQSASTRKFGGIIELVGVSAGALIGSLILCEIAARFYHAPKKSEENPKIKRAGGLSIHFKE